MQSWIRIHTSRPIIRFSPLRCAYGLFSWIYFSSLCYLATICRLRNYSILWMALSEACEVLTLSGDSSSFECVRYYIYIQCTSSGWNVHPSKSLSTSFPRFSSIFSYRVLSHALCRSKKLSEYSTMNVSVTWFLGLVVTLKYRFECALWIMLPLCQSLLMLFLSCLLCDSCLRMIVWCYHLI